MTKAQRISLIVSGVISLVIVGGAVVISQRPKPAAVPAAQEQRDVTKAELTKADGKDGRDCLVAVDGTVYKIEDFSLWQNGKHTSSQGLAYCGADMSKVIDKAPHGRKNLDLLIKVGSFKP